MKFLKKTISLLLFTIFSFTVAAQEKGWWLDEPYRLVQTNLREIDAGDFDMDVYVESLTDIGANTVLAQLGAPVCATSMSLSPMRIETSMRIEDSLADGVSFFMAELKRLKQIVDVARQYESRDDCCVLFLLDEILQGTNSRERHIAVTRVVSHLIRHGAIGCVSTHDLELGTAPELKDACRPIHFRESFETIDGQKRMTFDYVARSGK